MKTSVIVAGAAAAVSLVVDAAAAFNVRDFGAKGDGISKDTAAVQRAVDAAGAAGGGEVLLPKGTYLCGSVFLKSGVDFHLAGGAVLKGSPDRSDYNAVDVAPQNWGRLGVGDNTSGGHLILCIEQENVTLRGPGRIDGNVGAFLKMPDGTHPPNKLKIPWRPSQMVWFVESRNIAIRDIELADAPYWSCFVHGCEDVVVERANIHTVRRPHTYNGDGLDIDSSRRVRVADCDISTADDSITLRADGKRLKAAGGREGREALPDCADVVVSNCTLSSDCNAIRIGVGNGRIRDCSFHGIKILDTRYAVNAVGAWSRPEHGVDISRISFEDLEVDAKGFCKFYYKKATGSVFDGISFRHVRGKVLEQSIFDDTPERPFRNLRFEDVVLDGETSPRVLEGGRRLALPTLAHTPVKAGRWKTFTYDKPDKTPIVFGGWSRAEGVKSRDYCVYLDVHYANGSQEWGLGRQADWRQGTHDWEYACAVLLPKKPVAKIEAYVFNRHGTGKAEFRDIFLERREGNGDRVNYARMTVKPFADEDEVSYGVFTGRKIDKKTERAPSTFSFTPPPDGVTVWTASSMDLVTPLTLPPDGAAKSISLSLARRERESAQLLVSCGADTELAGVTLEVDPLKDASGRVLDGAVKWERVGYVPRKAGYLRHPCSPEDREMWIPDPLLPAAPFKVRRASTQGAWLTVYAAPEAKPGSYRSEVRVRQGGKTLAVVPLAATVIDFELGSTFALDTAFSLMDGFMRAEYPETWRQMKKQAIDIMLDHRLNPDDISRTSPPEIEDLLHAKARGMSRFNILNVVPEPKKEVKWVFSAGPSELFTEEFYQTFTGRLRPYLKKLEENGLDGMAYIYGFDECQANYYLGIDKMWKRLKTDFPNLPMMTTTKMFRDLVRGKTNNFHCVTTDWYCPVSNDYNAKWADYLRAKGKKVWWYTCCSPGNPFANMASLEYPAVEGRLLLGYLTWLYRADGFLFWHVNNWRTGNAPMDETDTYFPEWNTWNYLGIPEDGIFLYPGKEHILPSIRFANIRDGEEDYEYLLHAEKRIGREAVEALVRPLVRSQTDFTRDPAALSSLRDSLLKCQAVNFRRPVIVPAPAEMSFKSNVAVRLDASAVFHVSCPDGAAMKWVQEHVSKWFGFRPGVELSKERSPDLESDEGYRLSVKPGRVDIEAKTLQGVRYALYTLRQVAEPIPHGRELAGWWLPELEVRDAPALKFRGIHLCCFPETSAAFLERQIRLAAYYKFNYAVIESWGMFKSAKLPFLSLKDSWLTPDAARRLAEMGRDLGITLVPQFNVFGHASASRHMSGKHVTLDYHPERSPLFEPCGGWNWCLTNPETRKVQIEYLSEMHEAFLRPPFVHIGCDEANDPSCARCRAAGPYGRLFLGHVMAIAEAMRARGTRVMMWHDMLLDHGDARWRGFYANGTAETAETLRTAFPKDIVICDWYYGAVPEDGDYPTLRHFKALGFEALTCPFRDEAGIAAQASFARREGLFGMMQTVWNMLTGEKHGIVMESASAAAWGTPPPPPHVPNMGEAPVPRPFATHWRQCGWDMGTPEYSETGYCERQVGR